MLKIKFKVNNDLWVANLHDGESYIKKYGDGSEAITILSKKEIHFNQEDFTFVVVAHEMFHVYSHYQLIRSADLTSDQAEEVFAEMFGLHCKDMLKLSNRLFTYFKKNEGNV